MVRITQFKFMRVLWKCWFVYYFYRIVLMAFYIIWWSLRSIITNSFVSLGFLSFGMLICLVGLNGYFFMHSHFAVCSNHLQLMPIKKGFPSLPPKKIGYKYKELNFSFNNDKASPYQWIMYIIKKWKILSSILFHMFIYIGK